MTHKRPRTLKTESLKFRLAEADVDRLSRLAEQDGLSMGAVLRRLIRSAKLRHVREDLKQQPAAGSD